MSQLIRVVGSLNMDLVVQVPHQPIPGETVLGSDYITYPGGKGANQAVAAARAGGQVQMWGAIGSDGFGHSLRENLQQNGVDTEQLQTFPGPSGLALITVDPSGQNRIVVSPGANGRYTPEHLPPFTPAALLLLQLEIPLPTVLAVAEQAFAQGIPILLNPAPIQPLPGSLLRQVRYLVLNESEAAQLTQLPIETSAQALIAAQRLQEQGIPSVMITLGGAGLVWVDGVEKGYLPAYRVPVVDTTAAGDGFCGALAAGLVAGGSLKQALRFASAAAALAVTRAGAQPSLAHRAEIEAFLAEQRYF
ncbi:MAG: ribokinase [Thermostichus sp. DG_1_6_bins_120]